MRLIIALLFIVKISIGFSTTIVVTNTNNSGNGSLRYAVANCVSGDIIRFSPN